MKKISRKIFFFGDILHLKELRSFHIGGIMGIFHLVIIDLFSIVAFVAPFGSATWFYLLLLLPIVLVLFWIAASFVILQEYKTVPFHDAVLIAKWSAWPFVALLIFSGSLFLMTQQTAFGLNQQWALMSYYLFLSSAFLIVINFAVVIFALRHPFSFKKNK